jgi:large subunit ribosomal protein L29
MKAAELREKSETELNGRIEELKKELFNLRFQHAINQLDNPMRIGECKKEIARILTILRERELAQAEA